MEKTHAAFPRPIKTAFYYFTSFLFAIILIEILLRLPGVYPILNLSLYAVDEKGIDNLVVMTFKLQNSDLYKYSVYNYDSDLGWVMKQNKSFFIRSPRFPFPYNLTTNEQGYRITPASKPDIKRILILGDSQAFGSGVNNNQTFANLLAEKGYYVDNKAMPGYGTTQEYLTLMKNKEKDYTHILLFFYSGNDFSDNVQCLSNNCCTDTPFIIPSSDGFSLVPLEQTICEKSLKTHAQDLFTRFILNDVFINSKFSLLILNTYYGIDIPAIINHYFFPTSFQSGPTSYQLEGTLSLLKKIKEESNSTFTIYVIPPKEKVCNSSSNNPFALEFSEENDIPIYDLTVPLKEFCNKEEPAYFEKDPHLNPIGHRAVADFIIKKLPP